VKGVLVPLQFHIVQVSIQGACCPCPWSQACSHVSDTLSAGVLETSVLPVSAITAPPPSFSDVASPSATPNAASTATKENDKANGGLTKSDKIQIIVGTVVPIFCLIMSGIFLCLRKRGAKAKTVEDSEL
jgi:hypothetical protein